MMDEHLRDNVELLLRGKREAPSPDFAARMDSLLRPPQPAEQRSRLLPIALVAISAAAAFGLILWIARREQPVATLPATPVSQDADGQEAGFLRGTVTLRGLPPSRKLLNVAGMGLHTAEVYPNGLTYDPVPVDGANRIQGCLVFVRKGLEGHSFSPPKESKRLEFDRYLIKPRMMGIMVGQDLVIENRDRELHNLHTLPWHNKETNDGLETVGSSITLKFTQPEKGIKVKCDVHYPPSGSGGDWEAGWITVLSHPFYAVTDEHGRFAIKGLPPGKYTIEAWQEHSVPVLKDVEIKADQPTVLDLTLEARPPFANELWDLSPEQDAFKAFQGKPVEIRGDLAFIPGFRPSPPLVQNRRYVVLSAGKKSALCGIASGEEEKVLALPKGTDVILRGTFKGRVATDGADFVMEECRISQVFGEKFEK